MSYLMSELTKPKDTDSFRAPRPNRDYRSQDAEPDDKDENLVEVPNIRQSDNFSCGACAAMSVGKYYGVGPDTLLEWKKRLGTSLQKSTDPQRIRKFLEELGLQVVCKEDMTIDDLCYYHKLGIPVICPIQEYGTTDNSYDYGHYVVVIGSDFGYIFVQDSSIDNVLEKEGSDNAEGRMMIRHEKWDKVWHDEDLFGKDYDHFGIAVFGPKGD